MFGAIQNEKLKLWKMVNKILSATKLINQLIFFLSFVLGDVEVPQFINTSISVSSNHSEPVPHIMFLQIFLCQILQVTGNRYEEKVEN